MDKIKYVNRAQRFFEDKIDWKFVNYISDNLTKFEDEGYNSQVDIEIYDIEKRKVLHVYRFGWYKGENIGRFISHEFVADYKPAFEKYGLRFNIHIYGDYKSDNYHPQIEVKLKEELYEKIKNKCTRLKSEETQYVLIVKPTMQHP